MTTAAGALRNSMEALDVVANNLANQGTTGYKADRPSYSLVWSDVQAEAGADELAVPFGTATLGEVRTDFASGVHFETGLSTDVAIEGPGYLVVNTPDGPMLTRDGSLRIRDGQLCTASGFKLETEEKRPYQIDPNQPLAIASDGTISQNGAPVAKLLIVEPSDKPVKRGDNLFVASANPGPAVSSTVRQGRLEKSNVTAAESAVRLVSVMRQAEMLQRTMQLGRDMNRRSVEELARVGG